MNYDEAETGVYRGDTAKLLEVTLRARLAALKDRRMDAVNRVRRQRGDSRTRAKRAAIETIESI